MVDPLITCIMAVTLEDYPGAASNREEKFIRAVDSFLQNGYSNKRLIIVSDGCTKSVRVWDRRYRDHENITFLFLEKSPVFSGIVRQAAIDFINIKEKVKDCIFCVLDSDDLILTHHLSSIAEQFGDNDWVYFDDFWYSNDIMMQPHYVSIERDVIGNSSIAWRNKPEFSYKGKDGNHQDWDFIHDVLMKSDNYKKIFNCGYVICHIKGLFDR